MTENFIRRLVREWTVDTKKYRYVLSESDKYQGFLVKRLPLALLGTTGAIDGWEIIGKVTGDLGYLEFWTWKANSAGGYWELKFHG